MKTLKLLLALSIAAGLMIEPVLAADKKRGAPHDVTNRDDLEKCRITDYGSARFIDRREEEMYYSFQGFQDLQALFAVPLPPGALRRVASAPTTLTELEARLAQLRAK